MTGWKDGKIREHADKRKGVFGAERLWSNDFAAVCAYVRRHGRAGRRAGARSKIMDNLTVLENQSKSANLGGQNLN